MHTSRHSRKNSGFSTQGEHLVLLGLGALTEVSSPVTRHALSSNFSPQSHGVGPCSEGSLTSRRKSALQSTRSTAIWTYRRESAISRHCLYLFRSIYQHV